MTNLKRLLAESGGLEQMLQKIRDGKKVSAFGMRFYNRLLAAALIGEGVYVCSDFISARAAYDELSCVCPAALLPPKDDVLTYRRGQSGENACVRLKTLTRVLSGEKLTVVTSADALTQLFPDRNAFAGHILTLEKGKSYDVYEVARRLAEAGYRRESQVSAQGQFSLRGDILDVWAAGENAGWRTEFFGDEAESIRAFDIGEQVSGDALDRITVSPNTDVFLSEEEAENAAAALRTELERMKNRDDAYARAEEIVSDISSRLTAGDRDKSLNFVLPYTPTQTFWAFVRPSYVFYDDAKSVFDAVAVAYSEHAVRLKTLSERGEVLSCAARQLIAREKVFCPDAGAFPEAEPIRTEKAAQGEQARSTEGPDGRTARDTERPDGGTQARGVGEVAFHKVTTANRMFAPEAVFDFQSMPVPDYSRDYRMLTDDLAQWREQGYRVILLCGSAAVRENLSGLLAEARVGFSLLGPAAPEPGGVALSEERLEHGAIFHEQKTVLIGTYDLTRRGVKKRIKRGKKDVFVQPEVGDYVVHNVHGIGVCEQIAKLEMGGSARDYIVVRYAGGDKLYVPIENMDSLSKLVAGEEHPTLSKIGGTDFARVKEKVRQSVKKMAVNLVRLYAERSTEKGHKYSEDDTLLDEFAADFPYTETDDQLTAVREGLEDLKSGKIMDRLLCGDVGYGKTEVALRLAFKVIAEGKQVAFLSPTTILARQHYATVRTRMEKYGVSVGSLTRFDSPAALKKTLDGLKSGKVDLACGTHRLLSKDVGFRDLGLLILDEEQRFGVADKEKIKLLKKNVNVLSLSATPIPRTLHMSMVGIRDISVLDTPPADRIPVQTYVTEYTETLAEDAINREVNRGGQVFVVYNRVADIDKFASSVARLVPELKVAVAHGQMAEGMLERVIGGFVAGESDVLVASTIIENGIDMPRANTMIVVDADRLGLSQLYQLRGRVGRSNRLAYVYFTFDGGRVLTETAYKRLDAITQFTEFGSGFKIAMRDLEIRGAGNVLGREQHGHIEKVGYDLYCKLLEQAVEELRGGKAAEEKREIKVVTDFNAFIPESYVPDDEWRVRLYARIARLGSDEERVRLMGEMTEIYGKVPDSAANLLTIGLVKNLAEAIGASGVTLKKAGGALSFDKTKDVPERAVRLLGKTSGAGFNPAAASVTFPGPEGGRALAKFLTECAKKCV